MEQSRRGKSLLFRFGLMFTGFTVVVLVLTGIITYTQQMRTFRSSSEEQVRELGSYLEELILAEGDDFAIYQSYYLAHYSEIDIPYDFEEYHTAQKEFERQFAEEYPGMVYGTDISFDELSEELQKAYFIYRHEYWLLTFEKARKAFDLPYTYYLVPFEDTGEVMYMIDGERTEREDMPGYLYLGDTYYNDPKLYRVEWDTWKTGRMLRTLQEWDNEWGHTYSGYVPLWINGQKLGLIGTEVNADTINQEISKNVVKQLLATGLIQIVAMVIMLWYINRAYISRLSGLAANIKQYATYKNASVARDIKEKLKGRDEIAYLAEQTAMMIEELAEHMKTLSKTTDELVETKQQASEMHELANKDSLTGVRNKTAYDEEVKILESEIEKGNTRFGIVMIDLNYLKKINDTYGHEQGNYAIQKLCHIACETFKHCPIYRIGGDEFVAVLKGEDYSNVDPLIRRFNRELKKLQEDDTLEPWEKVSAAIGYAKFDKEIDTDVDSVFRRADKLMYECKQAMKAARTE